MREFKLSKLQICFNVLESIWKGAQKPTTILRDANLSWDVLFEVFAVLTSQGLIKWDYDEGYKRYSLTKKGLIAVTHYGKALGVLEGPNEARTLYA